MSTISLAWPSGLLGIPTNRGTSETAIGVSRDVEALLEAFKDRRLATSEDYQQTLAALEEVASVCARPGWDGYDARPVRPEAIALAQQLILALPSEFGVPLVSAHPDGDVALTWQGDRSTDFSVSISASGQIAYAAVYGPSAVSYGSDAFADDPPATILDHLRRLP